MHPCKNTNKDKNNTRDPCPENGLVHSFQMLRNNRMRKEQQAANNISDTVINPNIKYIGKNTAQNDEKKRNR